jgi:hypothetical protein
MSDEHDDGALTRSVRRFQRLARLADVDPFRLLSPDPLARLESLGAVVAALIDVEPFERLRDALASTEPSARGDARRARGQPLVPSARGAKPRASPAVPDRTSRAAPARDAGTSRAGQDRAASPASGRRPREEQDRSNASSMPTLAQRRGELRRSLLHPNAHSQLPSADAAQDLPPARKLRDPPRLQSSAGAPRARERVNDATVTAAARLLPPPQAQPHTVPRGDQAIDGNGLSSAPAKMQDLEASHRPDDGASVALIPAAAAADGAAFEKSTANDARAAAAGTTDVFARPPAARAPSPADDGLRPRRAASPVAAAVRRPQSWNPSAGLELTDDLFEVLYRNGVDLSWP